MRLKAYSILGTLPVWAGRGKEREVTLSLDALSSLD